MEKEISINDKKLLRKASSRKVVTPNVSQDMISKIQKELVDTSYYEDIKYNTRSKSRWKFIGDITEATSHIISSSGVIISFAAGYFGYPFLSFLAGSLGITSIVLLRFSSYSMRESRERTIQINSLLEAIGINKIVDITIDSADEV